MVMVAARCYECSGCGGLVREASRRCNYCGNPVATVRCSRCFMMNVPEAGYCIGCGSELGLMPLAIEGTDTWTCPRCRTDHLDTFTSDDGCIYDCPRCGGQFLPHAVLRTMIQRYRDCVASLPQRLQPANPLTEKVVYVPCPQCKELMLRRNFGRVSGVVVDVCSAHGIWFDLGEVPRILSFVANGGLSRAESLAAEEQRLRLGSQQQAAFAPGALSPATMDYSARDDMFDSVRSFVQWVHQMLR